MYCTKNAWDDDQRHVSRETVANVMRLFDKMFVKDEEITEELKKDLSDKGLSFFETGNYSEAEKIFFKLCEYDKSNSDYFYNLGYTQFKQEKYDDAIDSFSTSLELGLSTYEIFNFLAECLEKTGDQETAGLYYEKALAVKK
jgi:tetratricopeptide (TPR) repeat protein